MAVFDESLQPSECGVPLMRYLIEITPYLGEPRRPELPDPFAAVAGTSCEPRLFERVQMFCYRLARNSGPIREPHYRHRALPAQPGDDTQARFVPQRGKDWCRASKIRRGP